MVLAGPTLFEPFVEAAERIATASPCSQDKQRYTVALIITDGVINDMEGTKEALCRASVLPLSFVIVGVGNADFSAMRELDGDRAKLFSGRATAARDIVQFVPYVYLYTPICLEAYKHDHNFILFPTVTTKCYLVLASDVNCIHELNCTSYLV